MHKLPVLAFTQQLNHLLSPNFEFDHPPLLLIMGQPAPILQVQNGPIEHAVVPVQLVVVVPLFNKLIPLLLKISLCNLGPLNLRLLLPFQMLPSHLNVLSELLRVLIG